ncbi:MAG: AEC family transporter [Proteobacteria bacterium]|nr:AEC family transporter [Pseudomonadota bacterium]MBU0968952.1 AEC family transporter [Pseudomonadota bacterium]
MENFVLIISFLLIGMGLRRLPQFPQNTAQVLNLFVIYVSLPALVLVKVPELVFSRELLAPALMPWFMLVVSAVIVWAVAKVCGWQNDTKGVLLLLVPLGNTSFLGIPMVRAFFGEQGIPYAVLYDQLGSFLALATYGSAVLAVYGKDEGKPTFRSVIRKIISFPPFICLLVAFVCRSVPLPSPVSVLLHTLAATLVPVVMIAVGFQFTLRLSPEVLKPMAAGLFIKLALAPCVAFLVCRIFAFDNLAAQVSVFEAGMPPMVSAGAMAIMAGLSPKLTAALVGVGIFLSFITLPLWAQIL